MSLLVASLPGPPSSPQTATVPKVQIWGYHCQRCEHEWLPRKEGEPVTCPKCKSPYWNRPRQVAKVDE